MAASVTVLAPNGRRQIVKCTPNTTILQILEEVCKKQGYTPGDYDIKHHNKVLDTTSTFRFSGLPNNAQLELATAVKTRIDSEVTLAVNLEDGNRLIGNFLPDATLAEILSVLCPNEVGNGKNPVVIYTRREIYGDELKTTSLKSLGLRGGRAMVRLMHKSPEELRTQANISAPLPAKPAEEKPYHRTLIKSETETSFESSEPGLSSEVPYNSRPKPVQQKNVDLLKLAREKRKLPESPARSAESENQQPKTAKPKLDLEGRVEEMDVDVGNEPSKTEMIADPVPAEPNRDIVYLGPRNAMLFSLETARSLPSDNLTDDFFELTIDDARKILKEYREKSHTMENGVLMTSGMRKLEEAKKQLRQLSRYRKCIIRVQFPDRTILQGTFTPTETMEDVGAFVREYLEDKSVDFYLYTTPPKNILLGSETLLEKGCVPSALLHLGTNSDQSKLIIKTDVRDKFTTNSMASLAASRQRQNFTNKDVTYDDNDDVIEDIDQPGPSKPTPPCQRRAPAVSAGTTEKVPKWFKPLK